MIRMVAALFAVVLIAASSPVRANNQNGSAPAPASAASSTVVNINTASAIELEALPGVGAKTAALIIEYRQKNGPFKKIEELMNVRGMGEKTFLKLKPQLTVSTGKSEGGGQ